MGRGPLLVISFAVMPMLMGLWLLHPGPQALYGDNLVQNLPLFREVFRQWANGHVPLYNPYIFGGQSLVGNPQAGVFYPLYWMGFFICDPKWALDVALFVHTLVASLGMYVLLRHYGVNMAASSLASGLFATSGVLVLLGTSCTQMEASAVWIPWIIWSFERLFKTPCLKSALLLCMFIVVQLLTGYPQFSLYTFLVLLALLIVRSFASPWPKTLEMAKWLAFSTFFTILLSVPYLIPVVRLMSLTTRTLHIGVSSGMEYSFFMYPFLWPRQVLGFFIPGIEVPWLTTQASSTPLFLGILGVVGLVAAFFSRKRGLFSFYLGLFCISVIFSLGPDFFWQRILFHFPVYNLFRGPIKLIIISAFAACIVAGIGLDHIFNALGSRPKMRAISVAGSVIIFLISASWRLYALPAFEKRLFTGLGVPQYIYWEGELNHPPLSAKYLSEELGQRFLVVDGQLEPFEKSLFPFAWPSYFQVPALHGYGPTLPSWLKQGISMDIRGFLDDESKKALLPKKAEMLDCLNVESLFVSKATLSNWRYGDEWGEKVIGRGKYILLQKKRRGMPAYFTSGDCHVTNIQWRKESPHEVSVDFLSRGRECTLALSIPYDPSWHAGLDGSEVPLKKMYGFLLGVPMKFAGEGQRRLRLTFNPWRF